MPATPHGFAAGAGSEYRPRPHRHAAHGVSMSEAEAEPTRVELDADAHWDGGTLVVVGGATVPDGALVSWEVTHQLHRSFTEHGTAEVAAGAFSVTLDASTWPAGSVRLWLGFQTVLSSTVQQPRHVIDRYGSKGEHLTGDQVAEAGVLRRAEMTLDV